MNMNDDVILSCYLDGELDYARAAEVSDKIEINAYTRDRFVALATSQAQLRAYGQTHHNSAVPSHLTRIFQKTRKRNYFRLDQRGLMQLAAVLVVCVLSYFTGRQNNVDQSMQASLGPAIPTALEQTINSVLEYQKSGSDQGWIEMQNGTSARITPVKSFRGAEGKFYRMYLIDLSSESGAQQFWAMASRIGKENWQTRGVFTGGTPGNI
jgi:surface antigen